MLTKVFCTNDQNFYAQPLLKSGKFILVQTMQDADVVLFTGGEDVSPDLYHEAVGKYTQNNPRRDIAEQIIFEYCFANKKPMIGVCRGSQFLCVMAGGKLVQHISGHGGRNHEVETIDGRSFFVSSTHHQMQLPPVGAKLMAWSKEKLSKTYLDGNNEELNIQTEVEAVYYPNINAFAVQYHPEFMHWGEDGVQYFLEQINNLLEGKL